MTRIRIVSLILWFALLPGVSIGSFPVRPLTVTSAAGLGIFDLVANASSVPLYEKFELTFNISNTVATNLQFPYDPSPPPGLVGRTGVSVEGLFLRPGQSNWQWAVIQPGFLYQDYQRQEIDGKEWLYPQGKPIWQVRFAPKLQGTWQYRVRAQDASICPVELSSCPNWVESAVGSFAVGPSRPENHGFIEVSKTDPRYFAFSDGTFFPGLGHNTNFKETRLTYDADEQLSRYAANGVDFLRVWMTRATLAGSSWSPWAYFDGPYYGGYMPDPGLQIAPPGGGHDFALYLNHQQATGSCLFNGWTQGNISVKPNTTYRLSLTAKVANLTGPRDASNPKYGFTAKLGGWPSSCPDGLSSNPNIVPYLLNSDWMTLEGTITTTASQWFLSNLFLMLDNVTTGEAYISNVSLREMLSDGTLGQELLMKSTGDVHMDFNLLRSWDWDYALDQAAQSGVYLKLVVLEKNDRVWNFIGQNGALSPSTDNNNFYAAENTKVRRLHEYYWRYLAARWGYSTAIHSWELLNEGNPFSSNHYELANSFAMFMHQIEPSRHLVTTSFWHSYPVAQFWGAPQYQHIDYVDLHAYISSGIGQYEWSPPSGTSLEADPVNTYQGSRGAVRVLAGVTSGSKSIPIRGRGDWRISAMVRAQDIAGSCPYGAPSSLAGPQLLVGIDSPNTRVIPYDPQKPNDYWICTSPAGTYDYTKVEGVVTVSDDSWHTLTVRFRSNFATSGTAWFDDLRIEGPDGKPAYLYGHGNFDDRERMDYDTALYGEAYGRLYGASSVSGAGKPVVRGESGINEVLSPNGELRELANDTRGVWLHNYLWSTLNSGGLYELYWWTNNIRQNNLYFQYKALRDFMAGIPLDNGYYVEASALATSDNVRVVGQRDSSSQRAHLWIQNRQHTWWNVVNGVGWSRLSGTVVVPGFSPNQDYTVEWWEFDDPGNLTQRQSNTKADGAGNLILDLSSLPDTVTDAAVKVTSLGTLYNVYLPLLAK